MSIKSSIILRPILSEKGTLLGETQNKYVFQVAKNANKVEIKNSIETRFDVKVKKVSTINCKGKNKNMSIRTTVIVGFPGEGDKEFQELYDFVEDIRFDRLGIFTYSEEEGTTAADLDDNIPQEVKNERKNQIIELQHDISLERNESYIGKSLRVLVDQAENNIGVGRTEYDSPEIDNIVQIEGEVSKGTFVNIAVENVNEYELIGKPVD